MPVHEDHSSSTMQWEDEPETEPSSFQDLLVRKEEEGGDAGQEALVIEDPKTRERKQKMLLPKTRYVLMAGGLGLLILIIVIPLALHFGRQDSANKAAKMEDLPEQYMLEFEASLPEYTLEAIRLDSSSPQAQGYRWVMEDPHMAVYPTERLLQRFALATFYYALNGGEWNSTLSAK